MTTSSSIDVHKDWLDGPFVREAVRRSDGSLLGVLDTLSSLLNELEDRLPGVSFDQILAAPKQGALGHATPLGLRARLAVEMVNNGTDAQEVAEVLGHDAWAEAKARTDADISARASHEVQALLGQGLSVRAVARQLGVSPSTVYRRLNGEPVPVRQPRWMEVGTHCIENGYKATVAEFGCSKQYAMHARSRVREALGTGS